MLSLRTHFCSFFFIGEETAAIACQAVSPSVSFKRRHEDVQQSKDATAVPFVYYACHRRKHTSTEEPRLNVFVRDFRSATDKSRRF